jgi:hypothetical protein
MAMKRSMFARCLAFALLASSVLWVGCKDKEEPATVPVGSTSEPAAPAPTPSAAPSETASAEPSSAPTAAQPVATNTAPVQGASIDACCSALNAIQKSGKTAQVKAKAAAAAAACPGIAKLVKEGKTGRSAGLAQIRSALTGFDAPGECR